MGEIIERIFWENRDNLWIYAKEFIKKGAIEQKFKLPAIVVSHGFGGNCNGEEYFCKLFAEKEYAVYCFDFCGGHIGGQSGGSTLEMTISSECDDLIRILRYVQSLSYIDTGHISLLGFSQGGFVSALAAARLGDEIENLVMFFPALCIPDHARLGVLGGANYDAENVPDVIECPNGMKLSRKFHEEVVHMDPFLEIRKYHGRTLIIHGMRDEIVNYSYAVRAKECYGKGQCNLILIRDGGHGFRPQHNESAMIAVEHFLEKKKELLTIQVFVTGYVLREKRDDYQEGEVHFTGYCDNEIFQGCIMPEGIDVQKKYGEEPEILRAEYTLVGIDSGKNKCFIHIVNQKKGARYKPEVQTDSKLLGFLTELDLTATLEGFPGGLTVRIFG